MNLVTKTCFALILFQTVFGANYFFNDQENWAASDNDCGKEENSPIDIIHDDLIHDSKLDEPFIWSANFLSSVQVNCKNKGQSYQCDLGSAAARTMSGGNLIKTPMKLLQFHVHFGSSTSLKGSEHRVNGYQYPAEIHFVFMSEGLSSFSQYGDLAVWGFFIEVVDNEYAAKGDLDQIMSTISGLKNYNSLSLGQNVNINLAEIIPVIDYHAMGSFYRYKGGLTTPGCDQVVQWTVFQNPLYISRAQYEKMTGGKTWTNSDGNTEDMENTFRRPQPLNGRPVSATKFVMESIQQAKDYENINEVDSKATLGSSLALLAVAVAKVLLLH